MIGAHCEKPQVRKEVNMAAMKANEKTSEDFTDEERKALNAQIEKSMRNWPSEDDETANRLEESKKHWGRPTPIHLYKSLENKVCWFGALSVANTILIILFATIFK